MRPRVIANAPAARHQVFELIGIHMPVAIEARPVDMAHFSHLPDDHFQVPGNAEFFVIGHSKAVQID